MRVYFSGGGGTTSPEFLIPQRKSHVMPTFHQMHIFPHWVGWSGDRLRKYLKRKNKLTDEQIESLFRFLKKHREKPAKKAASEKTKTNEHKKRRLPK